MRVWIFKPHEPLHHERMILTFSEYPLVDLDQASVVKEIALIHAGGAIPVDSANQFARQMYLITGRSPGRSIGSSGNARKYWVERGISVLGRLRRGGTRKRGPLVGVFDSACWPSARTNDRWNLLLKSSTGREQRHSRCHNRTSEYAIPDPGLWRER
jgi:hypothetical protein